MSRCLKRLLHGFTLAWCVVAYADSITNNTGHFFPSGAQQVNWLFSGLLFTESGDQLAYIFQLERKGTHYHTVAALFDAQTKTLIFQDESRAKIVHNEGYRWSVGHAVLRFNPINTSWVLGVTTPEKEGFNFKIDMLDTEKPLIAEELRPGVSVLASQTQALNGHIRLSHHTEEQFVMAKQTWFRQTAVTSDQVERYALESMWCHLPDGGNIYSMRLPAADATQAALAGWVTATGLSLPISQFVEVHHQETGPWDIRVPSTPLRLSLAQYAQYNALVVGFAEDNALSAFCLLDQAALG